MPICQLIYASRSTKAFCSDDIASLIAVSQRNNAARKVTGSLLYGSGYFLQVIEGDEQTVHELFEKIALDPRHEDVQLLGIEPVRKRMCAGWGMSGMHEDSAAPEMRQAMQRLVERIVTSPNRSRLCVDAQRLLRNIHQAMTSTRKAEAA